MAELGPGGGEAANWLLAALAPPDYERLHPSLDLVSLAREEVLHEAGASIEHLYFPCSGLVALLAPLGEGRTAEVALVGKEGMVGLPVFLGGGDAIYRAVVQHPGHALRMTASAFRDGSGACASLAPLLLRYADTFLAQVSQSAVCNCHHPVPQRLCRWLLMAHDRLGTDRLPFTQKSLALMLTVRLASVSEAASSLREAGLIHSGQGHVHILDREGLERACCGCYRLIRAHLERWRSESQGQAGHS